MIGRRFGMLVVLSVENKIAKNGANKLYAQCKCDCGNEKCILKTNLGRSSNSCGCQVRAKSIARSTTHGQSGTRTHNIWKNMRRRCLYPGNPVYPSYGGRGIDICERWSLFENFFADMGEAPLGLTLDRIDNNKGYSPENCRWATPSTQARNTRRNHLVTAFGKTKCLADWADELGVTTDVFKSRIYRGMSPERAVTQPFRRRANNGQDERAHRG